MQIDHNFKILLDSLPPALLDQNVGELLRANNHDLNIAIAKEQFRMMNQSNKNSKNNQIGNSNEEKELGIQKGVEVKNWDPKSEKSPPKIEYKKKVIKNMKK